ncbi:MAG: hypothetical protein IJ777_02760 [Clostridia bacterium]|nr:hypothetical protein [Clostridia bacterium]
MTERKIGNVEAIAFVLTVMINHILLNLPKEIIRSTSSGAVLNTVFISFIILGITFLIGKLFQNFPQLDIFDIAKFLGGKWLKILLRYFLFTVLYVYC